MFGLRVDILDIDYLQHNIEEFLELNIHLKNTTILEFKGLIVLEFIIK